VGCDTTDDIPPGGNVRFQFSHLVGTEKLNLNTTDYTNPAGESFRLSMFKYYISNIELVQGAGPIYRFPNSYYLIDEADSLTKTFTLPNVPVGDYTEIRFIIGVDSTRNVSGAQTGALDPINGMFWEWKTGYIFVKLEGTSPSSSDSLKRIRYHIGGFQNPNNIRTVALPISGNMTVTNGGTAVMNWKVNVNEMLQTPNPVKFAEHPVLMFDAATAQVADNYKDMFSITSIQYIQP
jgi:hypothetical protein